MRWTSKFGERMLLLLTVMAIVCLSQSETCSAEKVSVGVSDDDPAVWPSYLEGFDTVAVSWRKEDASSEFPWGPQQRVMWSQDVFLNSVEKVFSGQPWISVRKISDIPPLELYKPNVVSLIFTLSAQHVKFEDNSLVVGVLAIDVVKEKGRAGKREPQTFLIPLSASFPYVFRMPKEEAGLKREIEEGVAYLTDYLPGYFACANQKGENACAELKRPQSVSRP